VDPQQVTRSYANIKQPVKKPLRDALKLLILIHVGGDLRIKIDPTSKFIIQHFFPACTDPHRVTPCFIRGQIGPVLSKIAHRLMREVLQQLEILSPTRDCTRFPILFSTFSVLFMAVETLQYHLAKQPYHTHYDEPSHAAAATAGCTPFATRNLDEWEGAEILRNFYKATFPVCNSQARKLGDGMPLPESWTTNSSEPETRHFFKTLNGAIDEARAYLIDKREVSVVPANDMSCFFDHLLAKFYLM
jgi:hypothetical protein